MRRTLLIAVVLYMFPTLAAGQADIIALYSDTGYSNCNLQDKVAGPVKVYVVHSSSRGAIGAMFKVESGAGVTLSYLGEDTPWPAHLGDTQSGLSVAYEGVCQFSDILVTTINYLASGSSATCSKLRVVPDPSAPSGTIEVVNCSQSKLEGIGTYLVINPDGTCECGPSTQFINWGVIKAKYE